MKIMSQYDHSRKSSLVMYNRASTSHFSFTQVLNLSLYQVSYSWLTSSVSFSSAVDHSFYFINLSVFLWHSLTLSDLSAHLCSVHRSYLSSLQWVPALASLLMITSCILHISDDSVQYVDLHVSSITFKTSHSLLSQLLVDFWICM